MGTRPDILKSRASKAVLCGTLFWGLGIQQSCAILDATESWGQMHHHGSHRKGNGGCCLDGTIEASCVCTFYQLVMVFATMFEPEGVTIAVTRGALRPGIWISGSWAKSARMRSWFGRACTRVFSSIAAFVGKNSTFSIPYALACRGLPAYEWGSSQGHRPCGDRSVASPRAIFEAVIFHETSEGYGGRPVTTS